MAGFDDEFDDDFFLDGGVPDGPAKALAGRECTVPLYFDIETVPDESRLKSFGLEPVPAVPEATPLSQLPDPIETITGTADEVKGRLAKVGFACPEWLDLLAREEAIGKNRKGVYDEIKKARQVRDDALQAHENRIKLLSTTPEYCSIAAIGWAIGRSDVLSLVVGEPIGDTFGQQEPNQIKETIVDEGMILELFWRMAASFSPLIGYNIAYFDIPVILARSAILGVEPTKMLDLSPWGKDIVDLYIKRFGSRGNTNRDRPGKLKELAPLYGIEIPAGDCDGSQVYGLMQTKEGRAKVGEYVKSDVDVTRAFHRKLAGYFWS